MSTRGTKVPKTFNFRGSPAALREVVRFAGLDVLNLANNHAGDYGMTALLDTVRAVRSSGAVPVGAGATLDAARRPQVVTRLGLRIAFVGFSDIGPSSFFAGPSSPGTSFATVPGIRAAVRAARRQADIVVATFHWGIERDTAENARQRGFASAALGAGAVAVIGAHPHVLQPIRRVGARKVVAYSLGNFVWAAGSAAASRTGILRLRLSARGVEGARLRAGADRRDSAHADVAVRPHGTLCRMRVRRSLLLAGLIAVAVGGCGGGSKDAATPAAVDDVRHGSHRSRHRADRQVAAAGLVDAAAGPCRRSEPRARDSWGRGSGRVSRSTRRAGACCGRATRSGSSRSRA